MSLKEKKKKNKVTVFSLYPPQKRLIAVKHKQDKDKKKMSRIIKALRTLLKWTKWGTLLVF